jgi:hypothetical protein
MKKLLILAAILVTGCAGGVGSNGEDTEGLGDKPYQGVLGGKRPPTTYSAGQFTTLTLDGNAFVGRACLSSSCTTSALFSITGRGTVVTGRVETLTFTKHTGPTPACARLAALADGSSVDFTVTALSATEFVVENLCDGSTYTP